MDDESGTVFRGQFPKATLELVAIDDRPGRVGDARWVDDGDIELDDAASGSPKLLIARPDHQPVEPRIEAIRVANGPDVQPRRGEGILDRIRARSSRRK